MERAAPLSLCERTAERAGADSATLLHALDHWTAWQAELASVNPLSRADGARRDAEHGRTAERRRLSVPTWELFARPAVQRETRRQVCKGFTTA